MTDMDDEAMKAMARRIADECCRAAFVDINSLQGRQRAADFRKAAYAAIIETRDRDAALAESKFADKGWNPQYRNASLSIAAAIRSGQQFRKDG